MVASGCNAISNKFASNKISSAVSSVVKSLMILIACFIISACFGHLPDLYNLTIDQWHWVVITGLFTSADWIFYFAAIKKSNLEAFTPFYETGQLLFGNVLFLIFMFSTVVNVNEPLSIVLYCGGLTFFAGALLVIAFSKKLNANVNRIWIVFAICAAVAYAFTILTMKMHLTALASDVISYHQIFVVFVVSIIVMLIKKEWSYLTHINLKGYLIFFISAIFNTMLMIFRYQSLSYANANPAVINIIISAQFVLVAIVTIIFQKRHDKLIISLAISLVIIGMVLDLLSGLLFQ